VSHQVCASQTDSRTLHVFHFNNNAPFFIPTSTTIYTKGDVHFFECF